MTRESITLDLDRSAVEIATGYGGVGVFMTILGSVWHGKRARHITVALPRGKADELARILRMAADASRFNEAKRDNLTSTVDVLERLGLPQTKGRIPPEVSRPAPFEDDVDAARSDEVERLREQVVIEMENEGVVTWGDPRHRERFLAVLREAE